MFGFFLGIAAGILFGGKGSSSGGSEKASSAGSGNSGAKEGPLGYGIYTEVTKEVERGGWAYRNVTKSRTDYTGFEDVTICRPKFIFFKVSGLRPNTRHFCFFDKINVTNYVNVDSFTYAQRETLSRNSVLRNPGEKYIGETGFPADQGGPSSVIRSNDAGEIEGCFYLQSNKTLNFPTGTRQLVFLDISSYKPNQAISYATASFTVDGGVENYLKSYYTQRKKYWDTWTEEIKVEEFEKVEKPQPVVAASVPEPGGYPTGSWDYSRSSDDDNGGLSVSFGKIGGASVVEFSNDRGEVVDVHVH